MASLRRQLTERVARDVARFCAEGEDLSLETLLRGWARDLQAAEADAGMWEDRCIKMGRAVRPVDGANL